MKHMKPEKPEQELEYEVNRFAGITIAQGEHTQEVMHRVVAGMHSICAAVLRAEEAQVDRARIQELVAPAKEIHSGSPLMRRLQTWPRGYAGDFETIEYLCEAVNRAQPFTLPWFIEGYALHSACAQQNRNKIAWQAG